MRTFETLEDMRAAVGELLGYSEWHMIDQERVTAFADITGDRQWIHVDPQRAAASPYGSTIAHGFLTLSLLPVMMSEVYAVSRLSVGLNYGLNRVRFPAPLPTGRAVRAAITLASVEDAANAGLMVVTDVVVEAECGTRPCCVAQSVTLLYP